MLGDEAVYVGNLVRANGHVYDLLIGETNESVDSTVEYMRTISQLPTNAKPRAPCMSRRSPSSGSP